jgi:hypothetical protein
MQKQMIDEQKKIIENQNPEKTPKEKSVAINKNLLDEIKNLQAKLEKSEKFIEELMK